MRAGSVYGMVRASFITQNVQRLLCVRRRSSGVEHTLGKGGVECSIHSGGTMLKLKIEAALRQVQLFRTSAQ